MRQEERQRAVFGELYITPEGILDLNSGRIAIANYLETEGKVKIEEVPVSWCVGVRSKAKPPFFEIDLQKPETSLFAPMIEKVFLTASDLNALLKEGKVVQAWTSKVDGVVTLGPIPASWFLGVVPGSQLKFSLITIQKPEGGEQ